MSHEPGAANVIHFDPAPENPCFGCGGGNVHGMRLAFEGGPASGRVTGRFRLGSDYQGSDGVLHGGITALLLDEAIGKLSRFAEVRAVTAELNIEYLKPIHAEEEIFVEAFQAEHKGRQFYHQAEIRNAAGVVLARGRGRFVAIGPRQ
jgi:uncharacterized protein (TIGR00369 family)